MSGEVECYNAESLKDVCLKVIMLKVLKFVPWAYQMKKGSDFGVGK